MKLWGLCLVGGLWAHPATAWVILPRRSNGRYRTLLRYEEQDNAMDAFSQAMRAYQQQEFHPPRVESTTSSPPPPPESRRPMGPPRTPEPLVTSEPEYSPHQKRGVSSSSSKRDVILGGPPALDFEPVEQTEGMAATTSTGYSGRPGENPPGATFESIKVDTGAWDIWSGKATNVKSEVPTKKQQQQQQPEQAASNRAPPPYQPDFRSASSNRENLMWSEGGGEPSTASGEPEKPKYSGRPGENPPGATFESIKVDTGAWDIWSGKATNVKSEVPTKQKKEAGQNKAVSMKTSPLEQAGEIFDPRVSSKKDLVFTDDAKPQEAGPTDFGPLCTFERISVDTGAWDAWAPVPSPPEPQRQTPAAPSPSQQQRTTPSTWTPQNAQSNEMPPPQETRSAAAQSRMTAPEKSMSSVGASMQTPQSSTQYEQSEISDTETEEPSMASFSQSLVSSEPQKSFGQYNPDYGPDCTFEPVGVDIGAWAAWMTPESEASPSTGTKSPGSGISSTKAASNTSTSGQDKAAQPESLEPLVSSDPVSSIPAKSMPPPKERMEPKPEVKQSTFEKKVPKPVMDAPVPRKQTEERRTFEVTTSQRDRPPTAMETPKSARFVELNTEAPNIQASTKITEKSGLEEVADIVKGAFLSSTIKPPPEKSLEEAADGRFVFNINSQLGEWIKKPKYPGQDWTVYIDNYGNINICYFEDKDCPPKQIQKSGVWSQFVTKNGQTYYYNDETKESQWNPPADFKKRAKVPDVPPPPSTIAASKAQASRDKEEKSGWSPPWKKEENAILSALAANEPDTNWLKPPKRNPYESSSKSKPEPKTVVEPRLKRKRRKVKPDILEEAKRVRLEKESSSSKPAPSLNLFNWNLTDSDAPTDRTKSSPSLSLFGRNKTDSSQSTAGKTLTDSEPKSSPSINLFNWNKTDADSDSTAAKRRADMLARKAALEAKRRYEKKESDRSKSNPTTSLFNFSAILPDSSTTKEPETNKSPTINLFGTQNPKPSKSESLTNGKGPSNRSPTKRIVSKSTETRSQPTRIIRKKDETNKPKTLAERKADLERRRKEYDEKWKFPF